ncbi:HTH domain-containing protein [Chryseolinea lacunae]|uniref:HTH domain-containing protein n=1 Tax=Chryseolinea lacunae TaxID=2801331 RepID=A0ABS1KXF0_9BACT|nr:HTH domain-containing protein [Chryseolinea lacunae]
MDFRTYAERLDYLKELVLKNRLPSPQTLANKFECSERTVRRMINMLRDQGLDIRYDVKLKKYTCGPQ